ncbi:MAG: hypothetical protein ACLQLG_13850 [Thermoguttaceae bacterium]
MKRLGMLVLLVGFGLLIAGCEPAAPEKGGKDKGAKGTTAAPASTDAKGDKAATEGAKAPPEEPAPPAPPAGPAKTGGDDKGETKGATPPAPGGK